MGTTLDILAPVNAQTQGNKFQVPAGSPNEFPLVLEQGPNAPSVHLQSKGGGYIGWVAFRADGSRRFAYESNGGAVNGANFGLYLYDNTGANVKTVWYAAYGTVPTLSVDADTTFSRPVTVAAPTAAGHAVTKQYVDSALIGGNVVIDQKTGNYTLVLADAGKMIEMGVASANTLTVPPDSSVNFPVGAQLTIIQTGAGQTTLTPGSGVTISATPGLKLRTTWSSCTLIKRAANCWVAIGDLIA